MNKGKFEQKRRFSVWSSLGQGVAYEVTPQKNWSYLSLHSLPSVARNSGWGFSTRETSCLQQSPLSRRQDLEKSCAWNGRSSFNKRFLSVKKTSTKLLPELQLQSRAIENEQLFPKKACLWARPSKLMFNDVGQKKAGFWYWLLGSKAWVAPMTIISELTSTKRSVLIIVVQDINISQLKRSLYRLQQTGCFMLWNFFTISVLLSFVWKQGMPNKAATCSPVSKRDSRLLSNFWFCGSWTRQTKEDKSAISLRGRRQLSLAWALSSKRGWVPGSRDLLSSLRQPVSVIKAVTLLGVSILCSKRQLLSTTLDLLGQNVVLQRPFWSASRIKYLALY